jgi:hypothetical protein
MLEGEEDEEEEEEEEGEEEDEFTERSGKRKAEDRSRVTGPKSLITAKAVLLS